MKHFRTSLAALLSTALATGGCQMKTDPGNQVADNAAATAPINAPATAPDSATPAQGTPAEPAPPAASNAQPPAPSPATPPTSPADKQPAAAVAVLQAYCDAIAHKDYRTAYRQWGGGGEASSLTYRQFVDAYAKYDAYDCSFSAPLDQEGAAGSIYLTVPAVITGTLAKGGGFTLRGPFTMRRVNDVDGSTAAQRHWHIAESALKPRP